MPICKALHFYLFICLFASSLFIDGPQGYDGISPFAHGGKYEMEGDEAVQHLHTNEQKTEERTEFTFFI